MLKVRAVPLMLGELIALFSDVTHGVQHLHLNEVVHRCVVCVFSSALFLGFVSFLFVCSVLAGCKIRVALFVARLIFFGTHSGFF